MHYDGEITVPRPSLITATEHEIKAVVPAPLRRTTAAGVIYPHTVVPGVPVAAVSRVHGPTRPKKTLRRIITEI
jgi:hypothetical protein